MELINHRPGKAVKCCRKRRNIALSIINKVTLIKNIEERFESMY